MARARKTTTPAAERPKSKVIERYDGVDVVATTIVVKGAGDGLSKALAVDPRKIKTREKVVVVIETECQEVAYKFLSDGVELMVRKHLLVAGLATIVDPDLVEDALERQRVRFEEAEGVHRLPGMGGTDDAGDEDPADS